VNQRDGRPEPVVLDLPFRGRWRARNSPARRVPSHGTDRFGVTYAIDFFAVDGRGLPAARTWRSVLATEDPRDFAAFGAPILAPCAGEVVLAHDGEEDHAARRSQLALVPYALGQRSRVARGAGAVAGNHVVIALGDDGPYVLLAHLRRGSVGVRIGQPVHVGQPLAECGNSGNSTQPHVHVQVTDSTDWADARGIPVRFRLPGDPGSPRVPAEDEVVVGA
jgi:hypothetical protein